MTTVALIDGPLDPADPRLVAREWFCREAGGAHAAAHAAAMRAAVAAGSAEARIANLVVFGDRLLTDAATVARALGRAAELAPEVVLCAFGLVRDDAEIAASCRRLVQRHILVVAAAPARGARVYPAALPGVVAVQGDARCGPETWSDLRLPHAAFGATPQLAGEAAIAGASVAAAHFAGHLAACAARVGAAHAVEEMRRRASHRGREARTAGRG